MKNYSFIFCLVSTLMCGKAVSQEYIEPQWKFYLAFEDATGAKDTLWVGLDEAAAINNPNPALGEVATQLDSAVFNVWTHKFGSWDPHKTIIFPMAASPSVSVYGMNAVLPVTLSWDTTLFQAPVLQASAAGPVCNPFMDGEWFFFNSNAGWLHHSYSMLFDAEIVLPEFSWGSQNHFPIDVAFDRSHDCLLLSVEITNMIDIKLYPNPCTDFLVLSTDMVLDEIQVYTLEGKMVLQESKTKLSGSDDEMRLDMRRLPPGMYMLQIQDKDGRKGVKKFVKGN